MSTIDNRIKEYNILKENLINIMTECRDIYHGLDKSEMTKTMEELIKKTKNDSFKVMIMGQFNAGKSTMINAMLGESLLPTAIVETTAIINEIKYAEKEGAVAYFKSPPPKVITKYIPDRIKKHIEKHKDTTIPPLVLSKEEIDAVAKLPKVAELKQGLNENEKELDKNALLEREITSTPFEKLEIYWPIELCKNGVEIIDTPGLNASTETEKATLEFIGKADTIVFLLSAVQACSKMEMDVIENICGMGHSNTFFGINRINQVSGNTPEEAEEQRKMLMEDLTEKLTRHTDLGKGGIIPFNAFGALKGRTDGNAQMVKESGIIEFEEALVKFLTNDKGKVKLGQPINEVKENISLIINDIIPNKIKSFDKNISVLVDNYEKVQPRLSDANHKKNQIVRKLKLKTEALKEDARDKIRNQMEFIRDNISGWIKEMNLENKAKVWDAKNSSAVVINEIGSKLQEIIAGKQAEWNEKELTPFITKRITEIADDVDYNVKDFCADIDKIKFELFSQGGPDYSGPSTAERVTCAIAGLILMDFGTAVVGGTMGFGAMMKNIGVQLAAMTTLMIVGLFNPVTFLAVILGAVAWNIFGGGLTKKIQKMSAEKAKEEMAKKVKEYTNTFVTMISDKIDIMFLPIEDILDKEIKSIEEEMNSILKTKKQGEVEVAKKKQLLTQYKGRLDKIYTDVDKISMKLNA